MAISWLVKVLLVSLTTKGYFPKGRGQFNSEHLTENEKLNREAITKIHVHLDDDRNGKVDLSESNEFMRDELQVTDEERHSHFHGNDDHISVDELWQSWAQSAVHNWTNEEVIEWLKNCVHLPQYADVFVTAAINGSDVPRLATEENGLLQNELGIKDPKHRKKIGLRAMDIVLFGPPLVLGHNLLKDVVVAFSVLVATFGCWIAILQKRKAKEQMERMIKDMKILQQAEDGLQELQTRLAKAEEDHHLAITEKLDLEARLNEELEMSKNEAQLMAETRTGTEEQMQKLKLAEEELVQVRRALRKAEKELEYQSWKAPAVLKQWLQMTFDKETKHFQQKRTVALKQMKEAKEACERIKKKRSSLMGSLRLAHDLTIDEVDQKILGARSALAEVTNELEERQHRWSQIESLCGFQIMSQTSFGIGKGSGSQTNSGSAIAEALVNVANVAGVSSGRKISSSASPWKAPSVPETGVSKEDLPPTYSAVTANVGMHDLQKESSYDKANLTGQESDSGGNRKDVTRHAEKDVVQMREKATFDTSKSHPSLHLGAQALINGVTESEVSAKSLEQLSASCEKLEQDEPVLNGLPDSPTGKSKKRLSWFGKRQDSTTESESSVAENDDETKRKVRWLWRSAVRKSKSQRNPTSKSDDSATMATSVEKLKSG